MIGECLMSLNKSRTEFPSHEQSHWRVTGESEVKAVGFVRCSDARVTQCWLVRMLPVLTATAERLLSSDSDWASGSRSNFIIIIFFHRLVSWPVDGFHSFTYISLGWFPSSSDLFFCWPLPKSTSIFCLLVSYFPLQLLELAGCFSFRSVA